MAVRTLPLEIELVVYAGTTLHREFRWRPDGDSVIDFSVGWDGVMRIGPFGGHALYELTVDNGGLQLTSDGLIIFDLSAEATEDFVAVANLAYQLDLTDPNDYTFRFLRGRVTIVRDVEAKQ